MKSLNKKVKKILSKFEHFLIFSLPVAVYFSYYPVIKLGENESMFFELSIPLIYLALLGLLAIRKIPEIYQKANKKLLFYSALIPLYISLSVLWSANKTRGFLSAGLVGLIFLFAWRIIALWRPKKQELIRLTKTYLYSAAIFGLIGIVQCLLNVSLSELPGEKLLLCPGCRYEVFGFPHPNAFAIEPQFFGNLLIGPCLLSIFIFYHKIKSQKHKTDSWREALLCFWLIMSLYVVFSRGALYSFALACFVFFLERLCCDRNPAALSIPVISVMACLGGLMFQGVFAQISPTNEGFFDGVSRSLNQVSLGLIDIKKPQEEIVEITPVETVQSKPETNAPDENNDREALHDGYIEESTDIRMNLSKLALRSWQKHAFFGVGIGGAGRAISADNPTIGPREIVQNEFVSLLLELGIVGVVIILICAIKITTLLFKGHFEFGIILAIAHLASMGFFSGVVNVLHIYMLTPVLIKGEDKLHMLK